MRTNSYTESLAAHQRALHKLPDTPQRARGGFVESPVADIIEDTPEGDLPVCELSPARLYELRAVPAVVLETQAGSSFIKVKIIVPGKQDRRIDAFCTGYLAPGDKIWVVCRESGRNQIVHILGRIRPEQERTIDEYTT